MFFSNYDLKNPNEYDAGSTSKVLSAPMRVSPIGTAALIYENTTRLNMPTEYFTQVAPYYGAQAVPSSDVGIHTYLYTLDLMDLNAAGSTNFGRLTNVSLQPTAGAESAGEAPSQRSVPELGHASRGDAVCTAWVCRSPGQNPGPGACCPESRGEGCRGGPVRSGPATKDTPVWPRRPAIAPLAPGLGAWCTGSRVLAGRAANSGGRLRRWPDSFGRSLRFSWVSACASCACELPRPGPRLGACLLYTSPSPRD